mgnify:CR=1 FL=1
MLYMFPKPEKMVMLREWIPVLAIFVYIERWRFRAFEDFEDTK